MFKKKYFKYSYIDGYKVTREGFAIGTPIVVLDVKMDKKLYFLSISEAARYFETYPKTIWRVVYGNKLYLGRYQMMVISNKNEWKYVNLGVKLFNNFFKEIIKKRLLIFYGLLAILLGVILYMVLCYLIMIYKEAYNEYVVHMRNIKINNIRYISEHSFTKNSLTNNYKPNIYASKVSRFIEENRKLKVEANLGICKTIMNEISLNFSSENNYLATNSINSSPIIERINLNSVFNTFTTNTTSISEPLISNSLGINRNSLTLDTSIDALAHKARSRELLNYQSNILYLLINKLSPSIY